MPSRKKVLILSVSAGTGHVRAAEALEKVFRDHPGVQEVVNVDALKYTNKLFRDFYSKLYIQMVRNAPTVLGWLYKAADEPWKNEKTRLMLDKLNTKPLEDFIHKFRPDVLVCTHFMPSNIVSDLIERKKLDARLSIVVTDFDFHAMWLSRVFHRYFVALPETKVHVEELGIPADRVTVSGIPIDPCFAETYDRAAIRKAAGLDEHLPLFLVSAGALGVSPTEAILEALYRLKIPAQIVAVCGKDVAMREKIEASAKANAPAHLKLKFLGYTNEMHRWMAAADLFIGKPGGLTTSEALAMGLPMVVIQPIPGQEERNSDHLLEKGIAIKCNDFTTLPYKIEKIFEEPGRFEGMRANARKYGRPDAAKTIVDTLLAEADEPFEAYTLRRDEEDE